MEDFISLEHIVKVYPPNVLAVDDVSVGFRKGEIHSIVGENGAGKSTLMKLLYGLVPFDAGIVRLNGNPVHFHKPADAIAMGIGMVHQEIELISQYTVWENVVLGAEPVRAHSVIGRLDAQKAIDLVRAKIDEFQFNLDPLAIVDRISVARAKKWRFLNSSIAMFRYSFSMNQRACSRHRRFRSSFLSSSAFAIKALQSSLFHIDSTRCSN